MQKIFNQLKDILEENAKARRATKEALAGMQKVAKDYNQEYQETHIAPKAKELGAMLKALNQQHMEQVAELLQAFEKAATAKHAEWPNLADTKLSNALKIIELSGGQLAGDQVRDLNNQFAGDTPSLRALKAIYDAKQIYDGGIGDMLYEPEWAARTLREWAYATFIQDGSLNQFAGKIARIAKLEGIEFPAIVDQAGVDAAFRRGAGLPED